MSEKQQRKGDKKPFLDELCYVVAYRIYTYFQYLYYFNLFIFDKLGIRNHNPQQKQEIGICPWSVWVSEVLLGCYYLISSTVLGIIEGIISFYFLL